ncbi:MAG: class I SAM-dependent methyltransferase, partial [Microcystaceae cyanobacterium]
MTQQISNKNQANLQSGWEEAYAQHGNNTLWQDDPIPFLPKVIQLLHEQGLNTAIDLGCGDGRNLTALAQAGLLCTGIDLSKTALNRVGQRLSKLGVPAFLIPGDIAELPFADQSVSAATCF